MSYEVWCGVTHLVCIPAGGVKCPVCDYVYGTKWEMNRHLKCKHGLKVVENQWEVRRNTFDIYRNE